MVGEIRAAVQQEPRAAHPPRARTSCIACARRSLAHDLTATYSTLRRLRPLYTVDPRPRPIAS